MVRDFAPLNADRTPPGATAGGSARDAVAALALGLMAFVLGGVAESAIIRAVHGDRSELEWISDTVLSAAVTGMALLWLRLKASRLRVLALQREQIAIDEQLRLAAEIQRNLLPQIPPATPGFRWAARMVPAGRIGGDFYDFVETPDGGVLVMLGDVSGKGVPAALILSSLKTLFRIVAHETLDPVAIAERLSAALHEEHAGLPYATAIVARFEPRPGRVSFVNAGHPRGYLIRGGRALAGFETGGPPLGLLPTAHYDAGTVDLDAGDLGVFLTDGVTEGLETGPLALDQALAAVRESSERGNSPGTLCDQLLQAAAEGRGPAGALGWQDDRTVLVFAFEPRGG